MERGRVMGFLNTVGVVGPLFRVFVAGIMYDTMGFVVSFMVSTAMMFISAVAVWA